MTTAQIIEKHSSRLAVGAAFRTPTAGPELDLVRDYVESLLPRPTRGQALTVFLEPEIDSGFPDVVAVYWSVAATRHWSSERARLSKLDVRVAHFLATMGRSAGSLLSRFFPTKVCDSLERLRAARVVRRVGADWLLRPLDDVFAVRRLVAIEAKVGNWREGLEQAFQNIWFASESYLLMPRMPRAAARLEAQCRGVGLLDRTTAICSTDTLARRHTVPRSYASWLFNEWVWRAAGVE